MIHYDFNELIKKYPSLADCENELKEALNVFKFCFKNKNKLLIAGNGGSASDADHIVGELMKSFRKTRRIDNETANKIKDVCFLDADILVKGLEKGLPAIALHNHPALNTAFMNDVESGNELIFAQQVLNYGSKGDVFLAITTSGNSKNVIYAAFVAKAIGMKVVALTGANGGMIKRIADISVIVPRVETFEIQELHIPIYHWWCLALEEYFFGN